MPTVIAMTPGRRARRWRRMRGPLGLLTLWLALATWALGSSVGMTADPAPAAAPATVVADLGALDPDAQGPTWSEEGLSEDPASTATGLAATGAETTTDTAPDGLEQDAALYALGR